MIPVLSGDALKIYVQLSTCITPSSRETRHSNKLKYNTIIIPILTILDRLFFLKNHTGMEETGSAMSLKQFKQEESGTHT